MDSLSARVAAIWSEVLERQVPTEDVDFFELGGDSISAMSILLRVEEDLGVYLDPGTIFEASRLSAFVDLVREQEVAS